MKITCLYQTLLKVNIILHNFEVNLVFACSKNLIFYCNYKIYQKTWTVMSDNDAWSLKIRKWWLVFFQDDHYKMHVCLLALFYTSCVAVCGSGPHVEASIHYHSSVLDQLLLQRQPLGWLANYSTQFPKTHICTTLGEHRGNGGTKYTGPTSWGGSCISELESFLQVLEHVFVDDLYLIYFIFIWS